MATVLIIEDNKDMSNFLRTSLTSENFVVDSAENGTCGIYKTGLENYDIIILDLNLPDMNGVHVCRELREKGVATPILILTVRTEIEDKVALFNSFADDYMVKPFHFDELLAGLHALLRRPKVLTSTVLHIGDVALDSNTQIVTCRGKEIYLTTKEFVILRHLMNHQEEIVPRASLMKNVWDMNDDPFSKKIEVHISNLRKKLNKHTSKELIETIPGRGYRIR